MNIQVWIEALVRRCSIKSCSKKFLKIYRKRSAPALSLFSKKGFRQQSFPVNCGKFFRTVFLWNAFQCLLLHEYLLLDLLGGNRPNTEFFLVRTCPGSDTKTYANLQLSVANLFKYVWPFSIRIGKIWTTNNSVFGHYSRRDYLGEFVIWCVLHVYKYLNGISFWWFGIEWPKQLY